jgi:hypothetical protein
VSRQTQKKIRSLTALKLGRTQGRRILKRPLQLTIVRYDNLVGFTMCIYSARQLARRTTIYVYCERRSINQICNEFTMYASSVRRSILSLVTNLQRTSPPYDDQPSPPGLGRALRTWSGRPPHTHIKAQSSTRGMRAEGE